MASDQTTAGEYPALGHAYITDDGVLSINWPDQKVMLAITTDGICLVASGEHYCATAREIKLDGGNWPGELRCVMAV